MQKRKEIRQYPTIKDFIRHFEFREKQDLHPASVNVMIEEQLNIYHLLSREAEGPGPMKPSNRGYAAVLNPAGFT